MNTGRERICVLPTNIGIARCTVSVATIVVVSAGVDISVAIRSLYHLYSVRTPAVVLEQWEKNLIPTYH